MLKKFVVPFLLCLGTTPNVFAQETCSEAEKQFAEATRVYMNKGANSFWERVLKNGPLEGDKRSLSQVQALTQIEQFFGPFQSSSVISRKPLGSRTCYLVGVLEYANGPAFAVATYYRGKNGVGATSMFFKTEPEAVLPSQLLIQ
jgi:hypothetical protein